ncbi:acyltransferase PGAP2-like [Styela clava]
MDPLVEIPVPKLAFNTVLLPLIGLIFSILWSLCFDFNRTTATHCGVINYLPSISAAIDQPPSSVVWKICIALHSAPRLLIAVIHEMKARKLGTSRCQSIKAFFNLSLNTIEVFSLLILTMMSSTEYKLWHKIGFITYIASSVIYCCGSSICGTGDRKESKKWKRILCIIYLLSLSSSMYFYYRHNTYCEDQVYTLFALLEYIVVISNIFFHYVASFDFHNYSISVQEN